MIASSTSNILEHKKDASDFLNIIKDHSNYFQPKEVTMTYAGLHALRQDAIPSRMIGNVRTEIVVLPVLV